MFINTFVKLLSVSRHSHSCSVSHHLIEPVNGRRRAFSHSHNMEKRINWKKNCFCLLFAFLILGWCSFILWAVFVFVYVYVDQCHHHHHSLWMSLEFVELCFRRRWLIFIGIWWKILFNDDLITCPHNRARPKTCKRPRHLNSLRKL